MFLGRLVKIRKTIYTEYMLKKAIKTLKNKGIVIYPTDTAYALGCLFDNKKGINQILKIKKRKDQKETDRV